MWSFKQAAAAAAIAGGVLGVILGPIMVIVKYMTGWAIIPQPAWIAAVAPALGGLLTFASPVGLWIVYGSLYTLALLLMLAGLAGLIVHLRSRRGGVRPRALWVLIAGLIMVTAGDAVHTQTWHQNGLTTPKPGTNPVANTGYAVHMMGMNFVLAGSLWSGIAALRRSLLPRWLAWMLALMPASIVLLALTLLPTTPSGGLWLFSWMMVALGVSLRRAPEEPTALR